MTDMILVFFNSICNIFQSVNIIRAVGTGVGWGGKEVEGGEEERGEGGLGGRGPPPPPLPIFFSKVKLHFIKNYVNTFYLA